MTEDQKNKTDIINALRTGKTFSASSELPTSFDPDAFIKSLNAENGPGHVGSVAQNTALLQSLGSSAETAEILSADKKSPPKIPPQSSSSR